MTSESYLVVLGGNQLAMPALARLKEIDHKILVIDGNPEAPGQRLADKFLNVNFSDISATQVALRDFTISGVMPINDFGVRTSSALAKERGLPGWTPEAAHRLTNKMAMKLAWKEAGLPTARYVFISLEDLLSGRTPDWNTFPCIVKPTFSGGGSRGVSLVNNWDELRNFVEATKNKFLDGGVIVEEYIQGTEHTVEVLVFNGNCKLLSISDKQNYSGNFTVVQNLFFPGPVGHSHRDKIEPLVYSACHALGLTDGAAHFEILVRDGLPYLLEVGGRPGGGPNFRPICETSTGYDYPALLANVLTGKAPDFLKRAPQHVAWHYFETPLRGTVIRIDGFEDLLNEPDVIDAQIYEKIGHKILDKSDDFARPGYVMVRGNSHEAAKKRALDLGRSVRILTSQ